MRLFLAYFVCLGAFAQALPSNITEVNLPKYLAGGIFYNQLLPGISGVNGWASGIIPIVNTLGIYESTTVDLQPFIKPVNGHNVILFQTSIRQGFYKIAYHDEKNTIAVGADGGYSFSKPSDTSSNSGISASVSFAYIRQLSPHFAIVIPVRAVLLPAVGGWSPIVQFGIAVKP